MNNHHHEVHGQRPFTVGLLLLSLAGAGMLFSPFSGPILFGLFLAVAIYPAHKKLSKAKFVARFSPNMHATLTVLILITFLLIPLFMLGWIGAEEAQSLRENSAKMQEFFDTFRHGQVPPALEWVKPWRNWVVGATGQSNGQIQKWVAEQATHAAQKTAQVSGQLMLGLLGGTANLFFLFFALFFFFRDGPAYYREVRTLVPLDAESQDHLFGRLQKTINAIIRGWAMTVLAQGSAATLGFLIAGVKPAVLLGILAGLAGIIPIGGTAIIWGPVAATLFISGATGKGIFIIVWGTCMVGLIDNLLAPYLISHRIHMPILFLLFGILGGTATMGMTGLFVGPLLLAVMPTLFDIYRHKILGQ